MRKPRPIAHRHVRAMAMLCMALIALGTLLNAAATFDAIAVPDGSRHFDAFTAIHIGSLLVAASAVAVVRPAFFRLCGCDGAGRRHWHRLVAVRGRGPCFFWAF